MQLGMVGLGKMGANMTIRLLGGGHTVVVSDLNSAAVERLGTQGAVTTNAIAELKTKLDAPRAIWVMVPSGDPTEQTVKLLGDLLEPGDIIIDGGNSNYKDSKRRAALLAAKGIHLVDVGTSGGIWGLEFGYSLMIGGEHDIVERLRPIFETLAPAPDKGWGYVGPNGAGHFVKMIHNGIEYGLMQAYAEGFAIMNAKRELELDVATIAKIWQHGSVVRSWLLDLTADALGQDATLADVAAYVPDSGEGRWTVVEAIDLNVSAPIITLSLDRRIRSRDTAPYADRLIAVMRNQFGGHMVKKVE
ncbi:MAG: decarboxylating 6-phosphogluconate dehydrogenase [Anaerolineae bacterium]|nr:decarboxylating 6-phosphogluconate dehydrogenase [Anaerolineae bacterium]